MATLQKIRSKGPLLVIVIGLALFAFIAGDAWKIFQPHQGKQDVGEVNGDPISAQDYQKLVDEYSEILKFTGGMSALSDEQLTQVKDEVWRAYVNNKLIANEADKLGLTVTKAEVQNIINEGRDPILLQTPFRNQQTGAFDKDVLKKFLAEYSKMDKNMPAQYQEYYQSLYKFWTFIEKTLIQNRLAEKYQNLITLSMLSNPVEAQAVFDERVNQNDLLLAVLPYNSIVDSTVSVSEAELKDLYNKKKEQFKQYVETRDIKYIDVQIAPSTEDRETVHNEVIEYSTQLAAVPSDYSSFIRSTSSTVPFSDVFISKTAYPSDVRSRLDSAAVGKVYGPYYNQAEDSYNAFKVIATQTLPDSVQYRQIQVAAQTEEGTRTLADSIFNALKGGADFAVLAKKYNNGDGEAVWLTAASYEKANLDAMNAKYINAITTASINELNNVNLGQVNVIFQVLDKKAVKDKYKVAVIKRPVDFSKETYNKAYNDFSQFIASNGSLDQLEKNAEENGYRILEKKDFRSSDHMVGGIKGTRDALKWIFEAKPGEVSQLYECGESDHMMVVAVTGVNKEGYRSLDAVKDMLKSEIIKDKKADKIMADLKAKDITRFDQVRNIPNMLSDTVKHVTFAAPTYVAMTRTNEPVLGAYASVTDINKIAGPIKGNSGVYILQVYDKEKLNDKFDVKTEEINIRNMNSRIVGRFMNDLYKNGNVKDERYLFF